MPVSRQKTLYELSTQATAAGLNDEVLTILGAATSATVTAAFVPLTANVATISGNLSTLTTNVNALSASYVTFAANTSADIANLDVSLTQMIVSIFDVTGTSVTGGSAVVLPASASGFITVYVGNTPVKIPFYVG
jgi:hypothetical protein